MGTSRDPLHVTLYNSSYIILFDDGSWSSQGVSKTFTKKMKRSQANIEYITLGPNDQWFFRLSNGEVFYYVEDENLRDELKNPKTRPYKIWFNDENEYVLQYEDLSLSWNSIPYDFHNKLNGRQKSLAKVKNIAFGPEDTWWVSFQDGTTRWSSDLPSSINKNLKQIEWLVLDPINKYNYFILNKNDHFEWQVNDDFDDDMNESDEDDDDDDDARYMDPQSIRYTQTSISHQFSNGQNIDELRHALEVGITAVDDIPMIKAVQTRSGNVWSLNNRRLWCFRNALNVHRIPVRIVDRRPSWFNKRIEELKNPFYIRVRRSSEENQSHSDFDDDDTNSDESDWY